MAYGTEYGIVIIDIIQKSCLFSVACPDLYGAHDPYCRTPKSPKRIDNKVEEQSRSPSSDQVSLSQRFLHYIYTYWYVRIMHSAPELFPFQFV